MLGLNDDVRIFPDGSTGNLTDEEYSVFNRLSSSKPMPDSEVIHPSITCQIPYDRLDALDMAISGITVYSSKPSLTLNQFQSGTQLTAKYKGQGELSGLLYATLGLAGEAGEFADKVKKILRDDEGFMAEVEAYNQSDKSGVGVTKRPVLSQATIDSLTLELGDTLYYLARCAKEIGRTLEQVAVANQAKLKSRQERGVVGGNGDNR
jgi:NTP pyrophosphatase (non-canonical NTP hydrolase)